MTCIKCRHTADDPRVFVDAIYPARLAGRDECADELACIVRRIQAGHRLPLPGLEPTVGVS